MRCCGLAILQQFQGIKALQWNIDLLNSCSCNQVQEQACDWNTVPVPAAAAPVVAQHHHCSHCRRILVVISFAVMATFVGYSLFLLHCGHCCNRVAVFVLCLICAVLVGGRVEFEVGNSARCSHQFDTSSVHLRFDRTYETTNRTPPQRPPLHSPYSRVSILHSLQMQTPMTRAPNEPATTGNKTGSILPNAGLATNTSLPHDSILTLLTSHSHRWLPLSFPSTAR
ncbi:hypothetical protein EI94DRAFT_410848 [Lactarius quietus]|nr:hypothetical protein EI94DRAFT_410848 [Lactarius quietus]